MENGYENRTGEAAITAPESQAKTFVVPALAKWIYGIGVVILIFGVLGILAIGIATLFGKSGNLRVSGILFTLVQGIMIITPGLLLMGCGRVLDYLAEIAFNTRAK